MKSSLPKHRNGFTLVELLVVMVILGILATVTLANFSSSQRKGRDAQRKSDLRQIANALEAYNSDHGAYPLSSDVIIGDRIVACGCNGTVCGWGAGSREMCDSNSTVYIKEVPDDVKAGGSWHHYCYVSAGRSYRLYTDFENGNDIDCLVRNAAGVCQPGAKTCNSINYMYGIASSNETP